jgi:membrane protein
MKGLADAGSLAKETFTEFKRHKSQWLAAAIAYFAMFAVAPLVIVVVEIGSLILGRHQALLDELYGHLASTAGPATAQVVQSIVTTTLAQQRTGLLAQIVGWAVFVAGAVGLFSSLQDALNTVWDVSARATSPLQSLKARLISFAVVFVIALLLLLSVGVTAALTAASAALAHLSPGLPTLTKVADFAASLAIVTLLFALLFEYLPECRIAWSDVWRGAIVSALLFVAGEFALGWYLGRVAISSGYGAFGGLVVFLVWVYYSAQIVLLGAEFTHVYAKRYGSLRVTRSSG